MAPIFTLLDIVSPQLESPLIWFTFDFPFPNVAYNVVIYCVCFPPATERSRAEVCVVFTDTSQAPRTAPSR